MVPEEREVMALRVERMVGMWGSGWECLGEMKNASLQTVEGAGGVCVGGGPGRPSLTATFWAGGSDSDLLLTIESSDIG